MLILKNRTRSNDRQTMMTSMSIDQARKSLFRLIRALERGEEKEFVFTRNGQPVARLMPVERPGVGQRIGVARGKFTIPETIDSDNDEIARLFGCGK
jgi:antitoxin (DNA-binding transcriptional repressor) of toxin-antitoxin stability system